MKFVLWMAFVFSAAFAGAETLNCGQGGGLNIPGDFLSRNYNGGNCQAQVPMRSVSPRGSCVGSNVTWSAQGFISGDFLTGQCRNGSINIFVGASQVNLTGTCSNGGSFRGTAYIPGDFLNGSCTENGMFNIFVGGKMADISGGCYK